MLDLIAAHVPPGGYYTVLVSTPIDTGIDTNIPDRKVAIAYLRETADNMETTDKPWEFTG